MKVFAITASGNYCTGIAIIAAPNEKAAVDYAVENIRSKVYPSIRWNSPEVELLDTISKTKVTKLLFQHMSGE